MKLGFSKFSALLILFMVGCASSSGIISSEAPSDATSSASESTSLITSDSSTESSAVSGSATTSSESSIPEDYPFIPGNKGDVPIVSGLELIPGIFPGLYIEQLDQQPLVFVFGYRTEALLKFPEPWMLGADTFRLQYFDTGTSTWANYGTGDDYVTDYNNFIVPAVDGQKLRLVASGGDIDGYVSNEVTLSYTSIESSFVGYMFDESMWITDVMWPFVGRGIEAEFTVNSLGDDEEVLDALTYQWYRVNPYTFAHTPIPDATSLTYITTMADLGYYVSIIATGDEINAGGFYEIISQDAPVTLPVKTFVSDITTSSFVLHFDYALPSFDIDNIELYDDSYEPVVVTSALLGANGTSVTITLAEASTSESLYLGYSDAYWTLVEHEFQMQNITITLP